jgi:hypothetical protein
LVSAILKVRELTAVKPVRAITEHAVVPVAHLMKQRGCIVEGKQCGFGFAEVVVVANDGDLQDLRLPRSNVLGLPTILAHPRPAGFVLSSKVVVNENCNQFILPTGVLFAHFVRLYVLLSLLAVVVVMVLQRWAFSSTSACA